jgi:hypothetical protein
MNKINFLFLCLCLGFYACKPKNSFPEINKQIWNQDKKACQNEREAIAQTLISNKDKILGLKEEILLENLGRPDKHDFQKRGRKIYSYYITPGKQCALSYPEEGQKIVFEMNALGLIALITIQN